MSQLLKESYENWDTKHSMVVYIGSNTDCKSSELDHDVVAQKFKVVHLQSIYIGYKNFFNNRDIALKKIMGRF